MPETNALLGYGILYEISDGAGGWTEVAEVTDLAPPNQQVEEVEASHLRSPGKTREFIPGWNDPGEASLTINWIPGDGTDTLIRGLKATAARRSHRITWPNGFTWTFSGFIKGFEPASPMDDRMTGVVAIRVTGDTSYGAAAAPTNSALPAISGVAQVGQVLTAWPGVWAGGPAFTYQWQEDDSGWANIAGATAATYTPVVGEVGNPLRVIVTGTNTAGTASATSVATADVIAA